MSIDTVRPMVVSGIKCSALHHLVEEGLRSKGRIKKPLHDSLLLCLLLQVFSAGLCARLASEDFSLLKVSEFLSRPCGEKKVRRGRRGEKM